MRRAIVRAIVIAAPLMLGMTGCEWFSDFRQQPSVEPWEQVHCQASLQNAECNADTLLPSRGNPQMSVSVYGSAMPGFIVSYQPLPATIDSMAGIPNPVPVTPRSLENGRKYFQINCAVCHGPAGMGDGPATKYGMIGINLTQALTKSRTDGYIWGMIRNGRGAMPSYDRIEEMSRWDVVNYVRGLQGMLGHPVPTGPLAPPGVTGRWVPGATVDAPTRQPPFVPPSQGSARAYYGPGQHPPIVAPPGSPPVGPPLIDSTVYQTGIPRVGGHQ